MLQVLVHVILTTLPVLGNGRGVTGTLRVLEVFSRNNLV